MKKRWIFLGILVFIVGFVLMFPYVALRDYVIGRSLENTGAYVFFGPMWPTWDGFGLQIQDTTVQFILDQNAKGELEAEIPKIRFLIPWKSLVSFSPYLATEVDLEAQSFIRAKVFYGSGKVQLESQWTDFAFAPYLRKLGWVPMDISGIVTLQLKGSMKPMGDHQLTALESQWMIKKLFVGAVEVGGFSFPDFEFGSDAEITLKSTDGKNINVGMMLGKTDADPIILNSEGVIVLDPQSQEKSTFNLKHRITISQALKSQPSVASMLPILEPFLSTEGNYHVHTIGNLIPSLTQFPTTF